MRFPHILLLLLLALIPFTTLVHQDDTGKWDTQRSAMAAPDEPSYLLMAQHFLDGRGLSLEQDLGRDTFYPPGYPLLIAGGTKVFFRGSLTPFAAHCLNATLLSVDVILVYLVASALFAQLGRPKRFFPPFIIAALFATNWHVLETSLLIMSEPAFMLLLFSWLLLALRFPDWPKKPALILMMSLLATAAWSVRGVGIVCVATLLLYLLLQPRRSRQFWLGPFIALGIPALYQVTLIRASPEKSLAAGDTGNSYTRQLLHAFTPDLPYKILTHLQDCFESFLPVARWREGEEFRVRALIAVLFGIVMVGGFLVSLPWRRWLTVSLPQLFVLLYAGLYLVWPFSFQRFWSPILPLLLVYGWDALLHFRMPSNRTRRPAATALFLFLIVLCVQELVVWQGTYARRLNHVSDALAEVARAAVRSGADTIAVMGGDEQIVLSWYLSQEKKLPPTARLYLAGGFDIRTPLASDPTREGKPERYDEFLLRTLEGATPSRVLFFSYFPEVNSDTRDTLASIAQRRGDRVKVSRLHEKHAIVQLWQLESP